MMWRLILFILPLTLSTLAIRVPVDEKYANITDNPRKSTPSEAPVADEKHDSFYIPEQPNTDSYLIPPDHHRTEEVSTDLIVTPATYFLPPSPEKQIDYYVPTEAGKQTDWYPIAPVPVQSSTVNLLPQTPPDVIPIILAENHTEIPHNPRGGKAYSADHFILPVPSRQLEPPVENAPNDYIVSAPSKELDLPSAEIDEKFYIPTPVEHRIPIQKPIRKNPKKTIIKIKPSGELPLSLHLTPPRLIKPVIYRYGQRPTKIFPKKVGKGFRPILIPISQFAEDSSPDVLQSKPTKPFKPISSDESEYFTPSDEKKLYLYEQAEQKRKLKGENEVKQQPGIATEHTYGDNAPSEQETSETNYRHPGPDGFHVAHHHVPHQVNLGPHPVRLRVAKVRRPSPRPEVEQQSEETNVPAPPPPGDRTEFRMHGMKGPHSYQFGFDTGKGKNRQFRYEERDNDGHVKGHYGYMDKFGKLRVVNYGADPEKGFHAEAPVEKE